MQVRHISSKHSLVRTNYLYILYIENMNQSFRPIKIEMNFIQYVCLSGSHQLNNVIQGLLCETLRQPFLCYLTGKLWACLIVSWKTEAQPQCRTSSRPPRSWSVLPSQNVLIWAALSPRKTKNQISSRWIEAFDGVGSKLLSEARQVKTRVWPRERLKI